MGWQDGPPLRSEPPTRHHLRSETGRRCSPLNQYAGARGSTRAEGSRSDRLPNKWTPVLPEPAESARRGVSVCWFPLGRQLAVRPGAADQRPLKITGGKSVIHDWNGRVQAGRAFRDTPHVCRWGGGSSHVPPPDGSTCYCQSFQISLTNDDRPQIKNKKNKPSSKWL